MHPFEFIVQFFRNELFPSQSSFFEEKQTLATGIANVKIVRFNYLIIKLRNSVAFEVHFLLPFYKGYATLLLGKDYFGFYK